MKILFVSTVFEPTPIYGGPVRVVAEYAQELASQGHEVEVLTSNVSSLKPIRSFQVGCSVRGSVRVHYLNSHAYRPHFSYIASREMRPWLDRYGVNFDLIHINFGREWWPIQAALWARRNGIPYILQGHGNFYRFGSLHRLIDFLFCARLFKSASANIVLQDLECHQIHRISPSAQLKKIPNGINLERLSQLAWRPERLRRPQILFVGRLHRDKRVLDFLDVARLLAPDYPRAIFRIIGPDDGDGQAARAFVRQHELQDQVEFLGGCNHDQVVSALQSAAFIIHPSLRESFGLSFMEAMAAGVPAIITTGCALAPEIAAQDSAIVVSPGSEQLLGAARSLLENPARALALSSAAQRYVRERYSLDAVSRTLLAVYREVVEQ